MSQREFAAPGKGPWELEATHFTRPLTRFIGEAFCSGFPRGFALGTARYGLLLSHFKPAQVNGFLYQQPIIFGAPEGAMGPPPKLVFQALTRLNPRIRARLKTGAAAFEKKLWRDDLRRWDEEVKPANRALQQRRAAIDPAQLDDAALADHVDECWLTVDRMLEVRHSFTATACAPVGEYLGMVREWTGKSSGEVLAALKGSSPISVGVAARELDSLGEALRADRSAGAVLDGAGAPADLLAALGKRVGGPLRAYLDLVGPRLVGYDISDGTANDFPEILVRAIRAARDGYQPLDDRAADERAADLRAHVPAAHRAAFDELLGEARSLNRLRDERGVFTDAWASGLARRGILEAGARLARRGVLPMAELLIDATRAEIRALLLGGQPGPSADELAARARWRVERSVADAPAFLTAPPAPPPPVEWLPAYGRRAARATGAFIEALFGTPEPRTAARVIEGLPVSPGVYEGSARLVIAPDDFGRIQVGDVLVTRATAPSFNVVLPLLGAIVTDRGGQLSHAAIVAREYGIPGVVGTTAATRLVADGARLRVDGTRGRVELLG